LSKNKILLNVSNVTVSFGGLEALSNVNMNILEGEILGLIGPNGAGKSTLFNAITGFINPMNGEISFKGKNLVGMSPSQICVEGVVRTFQLCRTFERMTCFENVKIGALLHYPRISDAEKKAEELLELFELERYKDTMIEEITLVNRKKIEVARALATEPQIALLDEAMTGLISSEIDEMVEIIRKIRYERGITICVVEHIMRAIMPICDRIVVLDFGKNIAEGTPIEVANNKKVIDAYFGEEITIG
jgi:branched-chain amino acid transport system ATP-binding protein